MENNKFYKVTFDEHFFNKKGFCAPSDICIISNDTHFIVIESDCIHTIYNNEDKIQIKLSKRTENKDGSYSIDYLPSVYLKIIKEDLLVSENTTVDKISNISKFIHYFGIKSRVHSNYLILKETLKEFKFEVILPNWK